MKTLTLLPALALLTFAATGSAQSAEPTEPAPLEETPLAQPAAQPTEGGEASAASAVDHRVSMWRFELGYRGTFVPDAAYGPFSTNDYLPQVSLAASRTLFTRGPFSFAPGIAWDHGGSSATARGDAASLTLNRVTVPLEGRVHLGAWGYAFLRAAPGVAVQSVEVDEPSSPAPFRKTAWLFATDLSAGYAWLVWPRNNPTARGGRLWLQGDGGYGWIASSRLSLTPSLAANDPTLADGIDLGLLSMSGGFFRFGAAMSF